jgi:hypothetical protein
MVPRYLAVMGIILATLLGLGVWLKPPLAEMREGVEEGLTAYAVQNAEAGETMPAVSQVESEDWLVAVSLSAKVGDKTAYCFGAFKVTFCRHPD